MLKNYDVPDLKKIKIEAPFWKERIRIAAEKVIPFQWEAINGRVESEAGRSYAVRNLKIAGGLCDEKYEEPLFQDSDIGKWVEAASYSLLYHPSKEIEGHIDEAVDLLEKVQLPDGYLNSYFIAAHPEKRYKNFAWGHELYCCGHLLEGALAYYQVTGKDKMLRIMDRYLDHLMKKLGHGEGQIPAYSGHPEIEIALMRLYHATKEKKYLTFCEYLINERGREPVYFESESGFDKEGDLKWMGLDYMIADKPFLQQENATGHAVRAMYLYAGAADLAAETQNEMLEQTLYRLWESTIRRRVYVTAGVGAHAYGERFSIDYDLPNDSCYTETCASIGLAFWAQRMQGLKLDAEYGDWLERAVYNGALSGIAVDGEHYFYVNPLEVRPDAAHYRYDLKHVKTQRVPWYGCCCCPPNLMRMITSIGKFIYGKDDSGIFIHQYIGNECDIDWGQGKCRLAMESGFPWNGNVKIRLGMQESQYFTLYLRIPDWTEDNWSIKINGIKEGCREKLTGGYIHLEREWSDQDEIEVDFDMRPRLIYANQAVAEDSGCVAVQRGPLIYCAEEADNGKTLQSILLKNNAVFKELWRADLNGYMELVTEDGLKEKGEGTRLYSYGKPEICQTQIRLLPYFLWGNRGEGEMRVWIRYAV